MEGKKIVRMCLDAFLDSKVGKVFIGGFTSLLADTLDEFEKAANEFVNTKLKKHTDKLKDSLKGDEDDGKKENDEDLKY